MKSVDVKIRIPKVLLRLHLTRLLDDILLDWREEPHIEEPWKVSERPFRDRKFAIIGSDHHAAVLLTLEHLSRQPHAAEVGELVDYSEWDLTEFAGPFIPEWRRRWSVPLPEDWLDAVELTDEDLAAWRARVDAGVDLPPELALPGRDLRDAFARMAWSPVETHGRWQRLKGSYEMFDLIVPADEVVTEPDMIRLAFAWFSMCNQPVSEPIPDDLSESLARLADAWASDGHTQVAEALRLLDPEADPEGTTMRVRIAADRLGAERGRSRRDPPKR